MSETLKPVPTKTRWYHDRGTSLAVGVIILVFISAIGLTLGVGVNLWLTKRSEPYREAVAVLTQHPEAQKHLGGGIEPSFFVMGEIDRGAGVADFVFEAKGGAGAAGVRARVEQTNGTWVVTYMDLGLGDAETGQTVAIIGETPPGQ
ncbi:MAG: cytochrome c oxidase assembly factor Coa1 family protein [Planctomycetota bacterium]